MLIEGFCFWGAVARPFGAACGRLGWAVAVPGARCLALGSWTRLLLRFRGGPLGPGVPLCLWSVAFVPCWGSPVRGCAPPPVLQHQCAPARFWSVQPS